MSNVQLYLAIGVPIIANFLAMTIGFTLLNARISDMGQRITDLRTDLHQRITDLRTDVDRRFDAMDAKLLRVEEVLDARLKALEERWR